MLIGTLVTQIPLTHYQVLAHPSSRSRGVINIFDEKLFSFMCSGETDESSSPCSKKALWLLRLDLVSSISELLKLISPHWKALHSQYRLPHGDHFSPQSGLFQMELFHYKRAFQNSYWWYQRVTCYIFPHIRSTSNLNASQGFRALSSLETMLV